MALAIPSHRILLALGKGVPEYIVISGARLVRARDALGAYIFDARNAPVYEVSL